jgi:hypothetical protein
LLKDLSTFKKILTLVAICVWQSALMSQSFDTKFGKNRVQFNNDFKYWSQYESDNFIIYWYGKGKNIAHTVMQMAELDHDEIRKNIEHRLSDKIEILVYVDLGDLKQTNIGSEELLTSESGETKIVGNKMLVYFDGNHDHLREKIKEGIAQVYFSSMQFGSNVQEVLQNAVLLDFPSWYKPGFISYAGSQWNILIEDELRDILERDEKNFNFQKLTRRHPRVAGHSMWYYLKSNYGKSTISNLLYLTRISRNFHRSVEFVLNTNLKQLYTEWASFYRTKYAFEKGKFDDFAGMPLKLSNKKYLPISVLSANEDESRVIYATNQYGKVKVFIYDSKTGKSRKLLRLGYKNKFQEIDFEYPHLAWHTSGSEFILTFQKKDRIYIRKYDANSGHFEEQLLPEEFQRLYAISYIDDRYLLINASVDGLGDLIIYDTKERESLPLTNDYFDDLDASIMHYKGKKCILFSSNRTVDHLLPMKLDTVLPLNKFDLFYYELADIKSKEDIKKISKSLTRITTTPDQNERYPLVNNGKIFYLNDVSGINNLYSVDLNEGSPQCMSNFSRNIIRHSMHENGHEYYYTLYHEGMYKVFKSPIDELKIQRPFVTQYMQLKNKSTVESKNSPVQYQEIPENLKFQAPFKDESPAISIQSEVLQNTIKEVVEDERSINKGLKPIQSNLITAAGLKFRIDKLTARMDNEVLFEGMELAQGRNNAVGQLPMGFLAKASFTDLFEDYNIEVGTRLATSLDGAEYFISFDNEKKLIDKNISIYLRNYTEKSNDEFIPAIISKKKILMGMYKLKYPIDIYQSIRGSAFLRFDKQYLKSSEIGTLNTPSNYEKRVGLRFEYVYDNSFENSINIIHGTRIKIYTDIQNQFNLEFNNGLKVDFNKGFTHVIGIDARHYIPLLEHSVLALRATSAFSMGSKKNIYYLGGINNNIFPSFNNEIVLPSNGDDFAYKSNVPHLRGFDSNIRNGSHYALTNMELRVPLFRYILGKERGATFFRNFQVVGFVDAGLAWYGKSPYSKENPLNTVQIDGPLIDLDIQYFRDPLVYGFGYGFRTQILGYYLRFDIANGVETKKILPKKFFLGIGYDF